jgi:hypothetical protein
MAIALILFVSKRAQCLCLAYLCLFLAQVVVTRVAPEAHAISKITVRIER